MAKFASFEEANEKLGLDAALQKEQSFRMEYHHIKNVEYKLIQALKDLDAVAGGRGKWKSGEFMWIREKPSK